MVLKLSKEYRIKLRRVSGDEEQLLSSVIREPNEKVS